MQDLLSQDEIDALLHGVDDGEVEPEDTGDEEGVKNYDLSSQDRIVRGRMPTLEMINERFARYTRISMFNFLRRSADVASGGIHHSAQTVLYCVRRLHRSLLLAHGLIPLFHLPLRQCRRRVSCNRDSAL